MPKSRSLSALALTAAVLLLAGCATPGGGTRSTSSTGPDTSASPAPSPSASAAPLDCAEPGEESDAVEVTGAAGAAPEVSFPTPTKVTSVERTVVREGKGAAVEQGSSVSVAYSVYEASKGKRIDRGGYGDTNPVVFSVDPSTLLVGFAQSLVCAKEGERFAAVIPAAQAFGDTGSEQLGVAGGDSIVFVADIVALTPTKADGTPKALPKGFPKVELADDGRPTITVPKAKAPTELRIAESKVGDGDTVEEGDTVTVQYQGVLWRNGEVFDQSWGRAPASFPTGQVVKGFGEALVGAKIGSQVVALIPPADGYGPDGNPQGGITGEDTLVFVIDILATQHAPE